MTRIMVDVDIIPETCCNCGTHFGMDATLMATRRKDGKAFYCPNGHNIVYKPESDKLKTELIAVSARLEAAERREKHLRSNLDATERSRIAMKGVVTRLRNRAANGVCPCCNRTFVSLHKHMISKHPDYEKSEIA